MRAEIVGGPTAPSGPGADASDRHLLARISAGDRRALESLYLRHHRHLARFLTRLTRRYDIAEEVINDTFFIVWQKAAQFRGDSQVSTWITGIAYRRALRTLRSFVRPEVAMDQPDVGDPATMPDEELSDLLARALERLSVEHRVSLELAYYLGHSCEEIAVIMGCPVNTVKTRLHYARDKLKKLLPQLAGAAPGEAP